MKSCAVALQLIARWNPRKLGWNLRLSPQMKWNPPLLSRRSRISSRSDFIHDSGFIPTKADFVEKSTHCLGRQMCAFFWWSVRDSNPWPQHCQCCALPTALTPLFLIQSFYHTLWQMSSVFCVGKNILLQKGNSRKASSQCFYTAACVFKRSDFLFCRV